jgi:hypothetical protein
MDGKTLIEPPIRFFFKTFGKNPREASGSSRGSAKILSHLGSWDRIFSHPTFFEVGGIENYPIPLLSRQVG